MIEPSDLAQVFIILLVFCLLFVGLLLCIIATINYINEHRHVVQLFSELSNETTSLDSLSVYSLPVDERSDMTIEMPRRSGPITVDKYRVLLSRHASWVLHNLLGSKKDLLQDALREYLNNRPKSFVPTELIYLTRQYVDGVIRYVFAVDDSDDRDSKDRSNVMLFAILPDVSSATAAPGFRANCHLTTEMYQAKAHSLISTSIEFALAARPARRINIIQLWESSDWLIVDSESEKLHGTASISRVKHFVSASYGLAGLVLLDFALSVRHRPPIDGDYPESEWFETKSDYISDLKKSLHRPLSVIRQEVLKDSKRGMAPPDVANLAPFFDIVCEQTANSVFMNLSIFGAELDSGINPHLLDHKYINKVSVPTE